MGDPDRPDRQISGHPERGGNPVQAPVAARRLNKGPPVTNVVQVHGPGLEVVR